MRQSVEFSYSLIDVAAMLAQGHRPVDVFAWDSGPHWRVVPDPLGSVDTSSPRLETCHGEYVRVPLFPHLTVRDPAHALGYAFQLGVRAALLLPDVRRVRVSLGLPIQEAKDDDGLPVFRMWVGCALAAPLERST